MHQQCAAFWYSSSTLVIRKCIDRKFKLKARKKIGTRHGKKTIIRERVTPFDTYQTMGDYYFRRSYRMKYATFVKLADMLKEGIIKCSGAHGTPRGYVNGPITHDVRLAVAIIYFSGGRLIDAVQIFKIGITDAHRSVWYVVEAVNKFGGQMEIEYPADHNEQRAIAAGFAKKSKAGFDKCAGCIDGLLIWIHKPTQNECKATGVGATKYFCGRKHKYGLNLQAVCDASYRFLDLSLQYGASTSDFFAFNSSCLREKLEEENFLCPGFHLFGDNAYVNTYYMATPYPGQNSNTDRSKDDYNFFHSSIRINIECAFGILVHRWAFLRKCAPAGLSIAKIVSLVVCLCKLHNFCIDNNDTNADNKTATVAVRNSIDGAISLGILNVPHELLNGGCHFEDVTKGVTAAYARRNRFPPSDQITTSNTMQTINLPREINKDIMLSKGLRRPIPRNANN
jgi:DDE superfamily endonuclease